MGLLTSLKNFFLPSRWKKNTTKQSIQSIKEQNDKTEQNLKEVQENTDEFTAALQQLHQDLETYKQSLTSTLDKMKEDFEQNMTHTSIFEIEEESLSPVFVTEKTDSILDFINSCDEVTKEQVLEALKGSGADKALFLTSIKDNEKNYVVLMNINSLPDHQGLALAYSKDLKSLSFFLSELTTLSQDEVKKSFGPPEN